MNTKNTKNPEESGGKFPAISPSEADKDDLSISSLTKKVAKLKTENRYLKGICFLLIILFLLLGNFALFQFVENWAGGIIIGILQLIIILIFGKALEIEDMDILITRILNVFSSNNSK